MLAVILSGWLLLLVIVSPVISVVLSISARFCYVFPASFIAGCWVFSLNICSAL